MTALEIDKPNATLLSYTEDYEAVLNAACGKPYGSKMSMAIVKKIVESGHLSVLEHCYASFEVTCSVRVLGQLTRHRHLSFTVQSARGSKFDELAFFSDEDFFGHYQDALDVGVPYEDAAYMLPQGVKTRMVVTGNLRAWYEYLPKRLCKRAMREHRWLAEAIHKELAKAIPELFDRPMMNCKNCTERSCSFA